MTFESKDFIESHTLWQESRNSEGRKSEGRESCSEIRQSEIQPSEIRQSKSRGPKRSNHSYSKMAIQKGVSNAVRTAALAQVNNKNRLIRKSRLPKLIAVSYDSRNDASDEREGLPCPADLSFRGLEQLLGKSK